MVGLEYGKQNQNQALPAAWFKARNAWWQYHSLPLKRFLDDLYVSLYFFFSATWISFLQRSYNKLGNQRNILPK